MARTRHTNPVDDNSAYKKGQVVLIKIVDIDGIDTFFFVEVMNSIIKLSENVNSKKKNISGIELTKESTIDDYVILEENGKFFFDYSEIVRTMVFEKNKRGEYKVSKEIYSKYISDDDSNEMEEEKVQTKKPIKKVIGRKKANETTAIKPKAQDMFDTQVEEEIIAEIPKKRKKKDLSTTIDDQDLNSEKLSKSKKKGKINGSIDDGNLYATLPNGKKRKFKVNPDIKIIEVSETFQHPSDKPLSKCCTRCTNKEVIRAALTKNYTLLNNLISTNSISSFYDSAGPLHDFSAIEILLMMGDKKGIEIISKAIHGKKFKFAANIPPSLKHYETGYNDKYAYGVKTRKVALSRGGREGNNALAYDVSNSFSSVVTNIQLKKILETCHDIQAFEYFITLNKLDANLDSCHESSIRSGNYQLARFIIGKCLKRGGYGFSELHEKVLLDKDPDFSSYKKANCTKKAIESQITPLHCAAINPNPVALEKLLEISLEYNVTDFTGKKPIHYAAACEGPGPINVLIKGGVDTRDLDLMKDSPLMIACRYGRLENVKVLIAEENRSNLKHKKKDGMSALHEAAKGGHTEIIKLLLAKGIDINFPGQNRMTSLHFAVLSGDLKCVEYLLLNGARINGKDKFKRTPLALACMNGLSKIGSYLLYLGADPNIPDSSENSPLHYAAAYGYDECVRMLKDGGCNINSQNSWKLTPLTAALQKGHFRVMETLMSYPEIDVNCKDDEGNTLVALAINSLTNDSFQKIKFLVENKNADLNITNLKGNTPLHQLFMKQIDSQIQGQKQDENDMEYHIRFSKEKSKIRNLQLNVAHLLIPTTDINIINLDSQTPLQIAFESRDTELAQLLISTSKLNYSSVFKDDSNLFHHMSKIPLNSESQKCFEVLFNNLKSLPNVKSTVNLVDCGGFTPLASVCNKVGDLIRSEFFNFITEETKRIQIWKYSKNNSSSKKKKLSNSQTKNKIQIEDQVEDEEEEIDEEQNGSEIEEEIVKPAKNLIGYSLTEAENDLLNNAALKIYLEAISMALSRIKAFESIGADINFVIQKLKKFRFPYSPKPEKNETEYGIQGASTALHLICRSGIPELIKEFIPRLPKQINTKDFNGNSPLHSFLESNGGEFVFGNKILGNISDMLELLLVKGADPNLGNNLQITPTLFTAFKCQTKPIQTQVRLLTKHGGSLNKNTKKNKNPLITFVSSRSLDATEFLLQNGADPNFPDLLGRTALHHAVNNAPTDANASFELESMLMSFNANSEIKDNRNRIALHYAFIKISSPFENSRIDPIETVSSLLSFSKDVNVADSFGNTPLHYAAQRGSMICGIYLMNAGAMAEVVNKDGNTPLGVAFIFGHSDFATLLIQNVKDVSRKVNIFKKEKNLEPKKTPEQEADKMEIEEESDNEYVNVKWMSQPSKFVFGGGFRQGFPIRAAKSSNYSNNRENDPNQAWNEIVKTLGEGEQTYFKLAIHRQWQGVAYLLIQQGYPLNKAIDDSIINKSFQLVLTLLYKAPADSIKKHLNEFKQNILHLVSIHSSGTSHELIRKIIIDLKRKKLDFSAKSNEGKTFLHYAAKNNNAVIIEEGMDAIDPKQMNIKDNDGITVLGYLLQKPTPENLKIVKKLQAAGAEIGLEFTLNGNNYNAFTYLMESRVKDFEFYDWLIDSGVNCNFLDLNKQSALYFAISCNSKKMVQYLLSKKQFLIDKSIDCEGRNPIHHAIRPLPNGRYEKNKILGLLVKNFNINQKDNQGRTPLNYANNLNATDCEKILTKNGATATSKSKQISLWIPNSASLTFTPQLDYYSDSAKYIQAHPTKESEHETCFPDPNYVSNTKSVLVKDVSGDPYDVWMTKVDIQKGYWSQYVFYKMQILFEEVRGVYILFTRWGTIGTSGQYQQTPFSTLESCYKEFASIFKSKSGNAYEEKSNFTKVFGKYNLFKIEKYSTKEDLLSKLEFSEKEIIPSKLESNIYSTIKKFSESKLFTAVSKNSLTIDQDKIPLHLLSRESLLKAKNILLELKKLADKQQKLRQSGLMDQISAFTELKEESAKLSSDYYELVPNYTYKDTPVPSIDNVYNIDTMIRDIETLINIETATKIIIGSCYNQAKINPVDYCFNSMGIKMLTLSKSEFEYQMIKNYIFMSMKENLEDIFSIKNIFVCERKEEAEREIKLGNKMYLWHGTSIPNFMGILTQGLRINVPNAHYVSGQLFGYGLYFADTFEKSLNYSQGFMYNDCEDKSCFLLLCEVALGNVMETTKYDFTGKLNPKFNSLKGCGREGPNLKKLVVLDNGVKLPVGELVNYKYPQNTYSYLQKNEYVVYDESQVKIKYLVEVKYPQ